MNLLNKKLIKYAQSDIYCRKDGLYASRTVPGLHENKFGAFVNRLVDYVTEYNADACKGIEAFNLPDKVSAEYNDYLQSEEQRLCAEKSFICSLGSNLFERACNINNGILKNSLLLSMREKGRELSDEETVAACASLCYSNHHEYWDACSHILDLDLHNTSFPVLRKLIERLPFSEVFPSQDAFDSLMESIRNDSHTEHVILRHDSNELILDYHDGFYFISVLCNGECPVFTYDLHDDSDSKYLDFDKDKSLSACWFDLCNNGYSQDSSSKNNCADSNEPRFLPIDGLHQAYERFQENGILGICGDWEVERVISPNRTIFERTEWVASFQHQAVAKCVMVVMPTHISGYMDLKRMANISDKSFSDFCDIVVPFAPYNYRMASEERSIINKNMLSAGR